jgi:hypothetical protein
MKIVDARLCVLVAIAVASVSNAQSIIPPDRSTVWKPGIPGGVPIRTTVCATVSASTYGNGANDATAGIQSAINSCPSGQVVQLSAGTFKIAGGPLFIQKGITLRGAGPTKTTLTKPYGTNEAVVVIGHRWLSYGTAVNLTSNAVKGQYSVTVASASGLTVGQLVLIDKLTDPSLTWWGLNATTDSKGWFSRSNRPITQMMEIATINGNTITFTTPFHTTFDTAYTAQLVTFPAVATRSAGIEDLKVYGGEGGDGGGNIYFEYAMYSWAKNVESAWSVGGSGRLYKSFRCEIRDSYFHDTPDPNPGGAGYGLDISKASSDNLLENNISVGFNKVIVMRASGGGNVVAYNYMDDGFGAGYKTIPEVGVNGSHMTTPHHELFEGNWGFNLGGDSYWGNSVYMTFFRNQASGLRGNVTGNGLQDTSNRRMVEVPENHWSYTFVGNVLGFPGMTAAPFTGFVYEGGAYDSSVPVWVITSTARPTLLRDGNFDYVTNQVRWDRPPQTIPNSLYLSTKPAFFGNCQWPWVDPTGPTKVFTLPARARFQGNPNACGAAKVPLPPSDVTIAQ